MPNVLVVSASVCSIRIAYNSTLVGGWVGPNTNNGGWCLLANMVDGSTEILR